MPENRRRTALRPARPAAPRRALHDVIAASAAIAALAALPTAAASPALAYAETPVLQITPTDPQSEGLGDLVFSGSCPIGSVAAVIDVLRDNSVVLVHSTQMVDGEFTSDAFGFGGAPGETQSFTLTCYDADYDQAAGPHGGRNAVGSAVPASITYPDHGSSIVLQPETRLDEQLTPQIFCGPAEGGTTADLVLSGDPDHPFDAVLAEWPQVQSSEPVSFGTPADFGAVAGQTLAVLLFCVDDSGEGRHLRSQRWATTVVTAPPAPTPVPEQTPLAQPPARLADTGSVATGATAFALGGTALLLAAAGSLFVGRRRSN